MSIADDWTGPPIVTWHTCVEPLSTYHAVCQCLPCEQQISRDPWITCHPQLFLPESMLSKTLPLPCTPLLQLFITYTSSLFFMRTQRHLNQYIATCVEAWTHHHHNHAIATPLLLYLVIVNVCKVDVHKNMCDICHTTLSSVPRSCTLWWAWSADDTSPTPSSWRPNNLQYTLQMRLRTENKPQLHKHT